MGTFPCFQGKGCQACNNTGYRGRVAIYEGRPLSEQIRELTLVSASAPEIKREAMKLGMMTLRRSAIIKLKEGITTVEEVIRTSSRD
ncbi:MAG TPA: hypothetical protein DCZ69_16455 [Syntrophobacteraceae bacterium]|nr:hypothetical protein [Syntrophobacteraceae bacterium]